MRQGIVYCAVEQKTGSEFVPSKNPMGQFETTLTQSQVYKGVSRHSPFMIGHSEVRLLNGVLKCAMESLIRRLHRKIGQNSSPQKILQSNSKQLYPSLTRNHMATESGKFGRPGTQRANQAVTNVFILPSPRKAKKAF